MTRTVLLLAALAAVVALAPGCGGDDLSGDADVPEGWQTVREGSVSFAVPGDWEVTREPGRDGAMKVEARGPGEERLAPVVTVLAEAAPGTGVGTQLSLRETADERLPNADAEEPRDVELDGAERAARWTTTYEAPDGKGRIDGVAAQREDGSSVNLRALALDRSEVDTAAIADSLRLDG
jgi:hypothetical protein